LPDTYLGLPPHAEAGQVVEALGSAGVFERLYDRRPAGALDPLLLRRLLSEADARGPQGLVLSLLVHMATALPLLAETAATPFAGKVLRSALDGTVLLALAATDEAAGSDLTSLGTALEIGDLGDGDAGVSLNGTKRWVTSACTADYALVLARHRPGRHFTNFTWVLVPLSAPGVTVRPADTELFRGSGVGHVEFSDVALDHGHLLSRPGRGLALFARHIAVERLASAAWAVALCRRVITETEQRLSARTVDGTPLNRHPGVRGRLAECAVRVSTLHALWTTSYERIAADRDSTAAAVLKAASGATVEHVLTTCGQLHGADGFNTGGIQQLRAEAAIFGIGGGATELVLDTVADRLGAVLAGLAP
jgi:alkylation response protein AidB-like acyl-CoA dehydrogenase